MDFDLSKITGREPSLQTNENILEMRIEDLENQLSYAYSIINDGFKRGSFDFTVLKDRAKNWHKGFR